VNLGLRRLPSADLDEPAPSYTIPSCRRPPGSGRPIYPHLLRHTVATRLLALGMDITDLQRFLGHGSIATTRLHAETTAATLHRRFDQLTDSAARWSPGSGNGKGMKQRCWLLICWRSAGRSASVPLVHKVVVLAAPKALVHPAS
jgi:hypothetical protein